MRRNWLYPTFRLMLMYQNVSIMVHHRVMGTDPHVHMTCGYLLTHWGYLSSAVCHWPGKDPHWKKWFKLGAFYTETPAKLTNQRTHHLHYWECGKLKALTSTWLPDGLHHTGGGYHVIQALEDPRVQMSKAFSRLRYWASWGDRTNSLCTSNWVQFSIPFCVHCLS